MAGPKGESAWSKIIRALDDLDKAIRELLRYIREYYLEIDIEALNKAAWNQYVQEHDDFRKGILGEE